MTTFRKLCLGGLAAFVLAGCDTTGTNNALSFLATGEEAPNLALARTTVAGGDVTVLGPDGYCVDASTQRSTRTTGFATLASCNILSGGQSGPIVEPGIVTVTVQPAGDTAPTMAALAAAIGTELLAENEMSAVTVGQMATGGESAFDGSDARHWRGVFEMNGHIVGLALYAPKDSPLVGAQGAAFLNTVSSRIRANSTAQDPSAEQSQNTEDPVATTLSRLFGNNDL